MSDLDKLNAVLISATALLPVLAGFIVTVVKLWRRDNVTDANVAEQSRRMDLLWQAHMRRGGTEAKQKRLAREDDGTCGEDPMTLILREDVKKAYAPLEKELIHIRRNFPDPAKFAEEVERRHGGWLAEHICLPLGVSNYGCLALARAFTDKALADAGKIVDLKAKEEPKP